MFNTAQEFFDGRQAERHRLLFENAVSNATNSPDGAKAALIGLFQQYDLKQFDAYGPGGDDCRHRGGVEGHGGGVCAARREEQGVNPGDMDSGGYPSPQSSALLCKQS